VYLTRDRVSVQFADDETTAAVQRKNMARLNLIRTQITSLINGWSKSRLSSFKAKARKYEGRVATALILCLEDDVTAACAALDEIKADIIAERTSWGRFEYLIFDICISGSCNFHRYIYATTKVYLSV
jgi:hypothetical protein